MSQSVSDNVAYRILSEHVRRRYADVEYPEAWRNLPEIPTKVELLSKRGNGNGRDETEVWNSYQKEPIYDPNIPHNIVNGPWPSTMDYLGTHYQLLREDGIATLRASIQEFRDNPRMSDSRETNVYTNVKNYPVLKLRHTDSSS
jgi:helicase required for RNAi-mediated heterochromatin assembly 1